ncbi:MAG: UDP-2,3-diacylglucosamine diphosphatase [Bacteroidetes bacterium QH_6_64_77]|nr:MAG: UDP-2,3-diacylglucosamine diphosphatase [Bacteroidetes bacterium QH_6_64_77]
MVLFVSDMHFGRGARSSERDKEQALIECLDAHEGEVDHLYLLGDVFDGYIEYRRLVPKGFVRFQGLLARWTDRGVPVTYLLGNHDPWHHDHFSEEVGATLVPDSVEVTHFGRRLHLAHGDAPTAAHRSRTWLRTLLRHPLSVRLYRALPADDRARALLRRDGLDGVVLAHSHVPTLHDGPNGVYANTGNWYEQRTFARLDEDGLYLQRWNGARAQDIESVGL